MSELKNLFDEEEVNKFIREVKFVKRKSNGSIPFGYKVSRYNRQLLEVIPNEILALHEALVRMSEGIPCRMAALWLFRKTGRPISHTSLRNYYYDYQKKMYAASIKAAEKIEEKLRENGVNYYTASPDEKVILHVRKETSTYRPVRKLFGDDTRTNESSQEICRTEKTTDAADAEKVEHQSENQVTRQASCWD